MNNKHETKVSAKTTSHFFSPWILAAAIGLLAVIIAVLAANNIRREKDFMTSSLFQKGQVIIRFVAAGLRVSATEKRVGMMLRIKPASEITKVHKLIEQASDEPEIHYIAVVDEKGLILAHSNPEIIGTLLVRDFKSMIEEIEREKNENSSILSPRIYSPRRSLRSSVRSRSRISELLKVEMYGENNFSKNILFILMENNLKISGIPGILTSMLDTRLSNDLLWLALI